MSEVIVSNHFLRRMAQKKERELTAAEGASRNLYSVRRAKRGPYRWYVVKG